MVALLAKEDEVMSPGSDGSDDDFNESVKQYGELVEREGESLRQLAELLPILRNLHEAEPGDPDLRAVISAITSLSLESAKRAETLRARMEELRTELRRRGILTFPP
jgi:hypothetical protein